MTYWALLFTMAAETGCATTGTIPNANLDPAAVGIASYYGGQFHGRRTASGEVFDQEEMTAAHRSLSFGTKVRVTNVKNDRSVVLRINDRGPFIRGRLIDLSARAARELGFLRSGTAQVKLEVLAP